MIDLEFQKRFYTFQCRLRLVLHVHCPYHKTYIATLRESPRLWLVVSQSFLAPWLLLNEAFNLIRRNETTLDCNPAIWHSTTEWIKCRNPELARNHCHFIWFGFCVSSWSSNRGLPPQRLFSFLESSTMVLLYLGYFPWDKSNFSTSGWLSSRARWIASRFVHLPVLHLLRLW